MTTRTFGKGVLVVAFVTISALVHAAPLGTAFTYQGRLIKNSSPIGNPSPVVCDMTFGLWDASVAGNQVGASPVGPLAISITNGLFTTNIDFGPDAINGEARWLEIAVQCPGDGSATTLTPRQELKPAPHALALPGLYTQQNVTSPNLIGGYNENSVSAGVVGATISGGGEAIGINQVTADYGTVGGGVGNTASGSVATVGGGTTNMASNSSATVGGGYVNAASGNASTVGGGIFNNAGGARSTVAGGDTNAASGDGSTIGGGFGNTAIGLVSTVGGGNENNASGVSSTIGGGYLNSAADQYATVGGGQSNTASGLRSTVGGGSGNTASNQYSTVGGGFDTSAGGVNAFASTVSGGYGNNAIGDSSTVPGGEFNVAGGNYSFAAGRRAIVRDAATVGAPGGDRGTFVWADTIDADFVSDGIDRFLVRASGGTKFYSNGTATVGVELAAGGNSWSALSDRNVKENVTPIDTREVLERLAAVPVANWNLISQNPSIRHIGPMAQDFYSAFGLGESDTHISTSDADGVAFAAIQGLHQIVREKDCEIDELKLRNDALEARLARIETMLAVQNASKVNGGQ